MLARLGRRAEALDRLRNIENRDPETVPEALGILRASLALSSPSCPAAERRRALQTIAASAPAILPAPFMTPPRIDPPAVRNSVGSAVVANEGLPCPSSRATYE